MLLARGRKTGLALCSSKARNISETGNETMTDRSLLKNDASERFTFEEVQESVLGNNILKKKKVY